MHNICEYLLWGETLTLQTEHINIGGVYNIILSYL